MPHPSTLDKDKTALVIVDIQEGFRNAVPDFEAIASRAALAVRGFQILGAPVLITEQYPKGLGRSAKEILSISPDDFRIFEKTAFSSCGAESFGEALKEARAEQIVLCGLETHVCVNQTAHDLLVRGFQVHLLIDCVSSRFERGKTAGLAKMKQSGVIPSSLEMALFELMNDSKNEHFKQIQQLIK